jgi:phosphopentomutase
MKESGFIDDRKHFGDIGATVLDNFNIEPIKNTKSFLKDLK